MTRVVAYDISDDRRRARAAALLQAHGERIQQSVYLLTLETDRYDDLMTALASLLDAQNDSVYAVRQCADCWTGLTHMGLRRPPEDPLHWCVM